MLRFHFQGGRYSKYRGMHVKWYPVPFYTYSKTPLQCSGLAEENHWRLVTFHNQVMCPPEFPRAGRRPVIFHPFSFSIV